MRESWEAPRIAVQQFIAGEYASTSCIEVRCRVNEKQTFDPLNLGNNGAAMWSKWVGTSAQGTRTENDMDHDGSYLDEHGGSCSHENNNYLSVNGEQLGIWEYSAEQQKDLSGVVTYWHDANKNNSYDKGDLIAWVTYNASAFWRHWGWLGNQDDNRPNHS